MATLAPMTTPTAPRFSTRQWVEEVARADARSGEPVLPDKKLAGYEFSNGRRFDDPPGVYATPD